MFVVIFSVEVVFVAPTGDRPQVSSARHIELYQTGDAANAGQLLERCETPRSSSRAGWMDSVGKVVRKLRGYVFGMMLMKRSSLDVEEKRQRIMHEVCLQEYVPTNDIKWALHLININATNFVEGH